MAESAESMSGYQYAGDNPLMNNDPDGGRFGPPQYGTSGAAALMNEVAEFDASVAFADDPSTFSTWNGYDFGGAGAASNGQSIYHAGDGTDADPMTGSFENARQLWNETVNQEKIDAGETPDPGVNGGGTESPGGSSEGSPTTSPVAYPMESFLASTTTDVGTLVNNANQGGTFPSFATLWGNYPHNLADGTHIHPYQTTDPAFQNQCAIRLGSALIKSGVSLKSFKGNVTPTGGYPRGAQDLADWLKTQLGNPIILTNEQFLDKYGSSAQGIFFEVAQPGSSAHIDLDNHGTVGSGFYSNSTIWFWPLK